MPKSGCNLENTQQSGAAKAAEQANIPVGGIGRDIAVGGLLDGVILAHTKRHKNFYIILTRINIPKIFFYKNFLLTDVKLI